jgi:hypothetical protein
MEATRWDGIWQCNRSSPFVGAPAFVREWVTAVHGQRMTELAYLRAHTPLPKRHKENPLSLIHKFKWRFAWSWVSGGSRVLLETLVVYYCCLAPVWCRAPLLWLLLTVAWFLGPLIGCTDTGYGYVDMVRRQLWKIKIHGYGKYIYNFINKYYEGNSQS